MKHRRISWKLEVLSVILLMCLIYKNVSFLCSNYGKNHPVSVHEETFEAGKPGVEVPEEFRSFCPPVLPGGYVFDSVQESRVDTFALYINELNDVCTLHRYKFTYVTKLNGMDDDMTQLMEHFYEETQGLQVVYFRKKKLNVCAWVDAKRTFFYYISSQMLDEETLKKMADSVIEYIGE